MNRRFFRSIKIVFSCFFGFLVVYLAVFYLLTTIPVKPSIEMNKEVEKPVIIYLSTNGVHTDFVVPIENQVMNWRTKMQWMSNQTKWLAFGWGDKGFYLETPEWSDLKVSTALRAMSGLGGSAMHVTAYNAFGLDDQSVALSLSLEEYEKLVNYIQHTFQLDNDNYRMIESGSYDQSDAFYEAIGSYSLFYTCNTWVNQGLKQINQKAALWTLHDQGIFRHYK